MYSNHNSDHSFVIKYKLILLQLSIKQIIKYTFTMFLILKKINTNIIKYTI